jgi:hypothetical protein
VPFIPAKDEVPVFIGTGKPDTEIWPSSGIASNQYKGVQATMPEPPFIFYEMNTNASEPSEFRVICLPLCPKTKYIPTSVTPYNVIFASPVSSKKVFLFPP